MSTIGSYTAKCVLCGEQSKHYGLLSYSTFGYPDLDFRPPSMYRQTMDYWMQECPNCGYVNTQLNQPSDLPKETIFNIYHEIESGFDWGQTYAIRFAKLGAMLAKSNDYCGAASQFLRVAWIFDDHRDERSATHWRKVAIEHVDSQMNRSQERISEEIICIRADMLRRAGNFQAVLEIDESQLCHDIHIRLIKYQKELSEYGDRATHTLDENNDICMVAKDYRGGMFFML